jgi:hypothetical protein
MIAALAPDQACARSLADRPLIGDRDLERRVHRLRARTREEDAVQRCGGSARSHPREALGKVERDRVAHLKAGRIIHRVELSRDSVGDFAAAMAGIDAP